MKGPNNKRKLKVVVKSCNGGDDKGNDDNTKKDINTIDEEKIMYPNTLVMDDLMDGSKKDTKKDIEHNLLSHLGDYEEEPFKIIESYFEGKYLERLTRHQNESFNNFVNIQIQRTINMFNPVVIRSINDYVQEKDSYLLETIVNFTNFKLYSPQIHENNGGVKPMLPVEAKLRNFTYASTMTVDLEIEYIIRNSENMDTPRIIKKVLPKINIGKLPIMIKSSVCILTQNKHIHSQYTGECDMDSGGYFVMKGSEKTVLGQERAAENKIYCFDGKSTNKWEWYAEIKSIPDSKCISPKQIEMMIASKNNGFGQGIYISIPRVKQPIELFVLFRAYGIISDKEICSYILLNLEDKRQKELLNLLTASIHDANKYMTKETAIRHIMSYVAYTPINMDKETGIRKKHEFTLEVLENDVFPHTKTTAQKIHLIGYMANKLLQTSLRWLPTDDRDSYLNKRIDLTGNLLNNLFRNYFNKLVKEMQKQVIREINMGSWRSKEDYENIMNMTNIYKIIKSTTIENGINRALSTGDFSIKQSNSSKVGVAQVLNRLTYLAGLSHLRRVNTPLEKSGELIAPRKLHNTTWGFLCLTGDTDVLLSNRIDMKKIKDIKNGDWVNTVNRTTLADEPSDIYNFFSKMPDKLYEITTISGRKIKATTDHPFLIKTADNKYEMKKVGELKPNDKMVVRHTVKSIPDTNTTVLIIDENDVVEHYRIELLEKNLLNIQLPTYKLKIIARLLGSLNTDGCIYIRKEDNYGGSSFYVGEETDECQLIDDINNLGFGNVSISRKICLFGGKTITKTLEISKCAFSYFMFLVGGFIGKKTQIIRKFPNWLIDAEPSIKREFLSSFQGGYGSPLSYQKSGNNFKPKLGLTFHHTNNEYLKETVQYMTQIVNLFQEFNIECEVIVSLLLKEENKVSISFVETMANLVRYSNIINYTYCEEKRRSSIPVIEHLKINEHQKLWSQRNQWNKYFWLLWWYSGKNAFIYDTFIRDNIVENGCMSVPIMTIEEIEPELVYDFTTISENHSFVASSFVCSNCPAETPEGQSIGIVKNISYMAHITIPSNSNSLYEYVKPHIKTIEELSPIELYKKTKVFINGSWVGVTDTPEKLYKDMKDKKYKGIINIYASIIFDTRLNEIKICNDAGRITRPLLRVVDNKVLITADIIRRLDKHELTWNDLLTNNVLENSVIEYIDPEEQNLAMIGMMCKGQYVNSDNTNIQYTHCEIHPSTIFGVLSSCIPFPEHNQAPRNTYQDAMSKQSIGVYAKNYDQRMDKTAYVLNYPSRPLVETRFMNMIQLNKIPSGTQIHVAIMTHTGYNQEDSVLINKASIDRGLFLATIYHTEKDEDKNIIRDEIIRCKPDVTKTKGIKFGNYNKLNELGFIPENELVENRDVIIAKVIPIKENRNDMTKTIKYEDQSKTFRTSEETYIDKNYSGRNGDGYNFAKVRVRTLRKPVLGDKFASRSGQKGTVGNIIPECDMPFTKSGLRPDLILNPHAIPSRMTIAQLKETLLGKILLELGLFGDATSFGNLDIKTITEELLKLGYESYGNEIMYNGLTGEQLETSIFIGPVFYQRLKHMVNDKQHSRSIGPMVNLTRQPAEGRSRDGGFRIGEMERDVMIAHGMTRFCRERLYDVSDKYSVHVCKKCGMVASYNDGNKNKMYANADFTIHLCKTCDNKTDFARVEIPYAYKLMSQELQTINVVPRIITE